MAKKKLVHREVSFEKLPRMRECVGSAYRNRTSDFELGELPPVFTGRGCLVDFLPFTIAATTQKMSRTSKSHNTHNSLPEIPRCGFRGRTNSILLPGRGQSVWRLSTFRLQSLFSRKASAEGPAEGWKAALMAVATCFSASVSSRARRNQHNTNSDVRATDNRRHSKIAAGGRRALRGRRQESKNGVDPRSEAAFSRRRAGDIRRLSPTATTSGDHDLSRRLLVLRRRRWK